MGNTVTARATRRCASERDDCIWWARASAAGAKARAGRPASRSGAPRERLSRLWLTAWLTDAARSRFAQGIIRGCGLAARGQAPATPRTEFRADESKAAQIGGCTLTSVRVTAVSWLPQPGVQFQEQARQRDGRAEKPTQQHYEIVTNFTIRA